MKIISGPTLGEGAEGGPIRGGECVGSLARGTGDGVVVHAGAELGVIGKYVMGRRWCWLMGQKTQWQIEEGRHRK
jgi:hypothetical protein